MSDEISKEYLCLFRAISDALKIIDQLRADLIFAQQNAENLYLERTD